MSILSSFPPRCQPFTSTFLLFIHLFFLLFMLSLIFFLSYVLVTKSLINFKVTDICLKWPTYIGFRPSPIFWTQRLFLGYFRQPLFLWIFWHNVKMESVMGDKAKSVSEQYIDERKDHRFHLKYCHIRFGLNQDTTSKIKMELYPKEKQESIIRLWKVPEDEKWGII